MVQADLEYNPYLLETTVRFNGNLPRINSLIEKYQGDKLQTWIQRVPAFFYDEMNGYYFELDFSGTSLDYEELQKSFAQAGVGKDQVLLFHKGELESRHEKVLEISQLLKWMNNTPNRKFDLTSFLDKNKDTFDTSYPFVIVGESTSTDNPFKGIDVSIDNVISVDELQKTDLHSTPILFYLNRRSARMLQHNLVELMKRPDISQEQLFFMIDPSLSGKLERVIQDLGVKSPQIVSTFGDSAIFRYIELFPMSEYIHNAIIAFQEEAMLIGSILEEENRESEITNRDIYEHIQMLDDTLIRLKLSNDMFASRGKPDFPMSFTSAKTSLIDSLNQWKKKKTKITRIDEAMELSSELESELARLFEVFQKNISQNYTLASASLFSQCDQWFRNAQYKEDSVTIEDTIPSLSEYSIPEIAVDLMRIKDEQYVLPKEDFFGKLFKTSSQEEEAVTPVLETIYYYEKWREHAVRVVEPIADTMIQEAYTSLCQYSTQLSALYTNQIDSFIQEVSSQKEQVSSQLSKEEQLLQADNNWYMTFCDNLHQIERS